MTNRIASQFAARRTPAAGRAADRAAAEAVLRDVAFVLAMTRKAKEIDTTDLWLHGVEGCEALAEPALA